MENRIKKHRAIIQSSNNITSHQRKAFNVLLYFAKEQLEKNPEREKFNCDEIGLRKLISSGQRIRVQELKQSLKELMDIKIEFNILENNKFKSWRIMVLLAEVDISENGMIEFVFPPTIRENILYPEIFCPLDLNMLASLKSKSSIAIYEFCKDYIKVEMPKLEIEMFKKMMGIENKYSRIYDLKVNVLNPALKEINKKTDITIDYDFITKGKKITHIKFKASKKNQKNHSENENLISNKEFRTEILILKPSHEILTDKEIKELKELTLKFGEEIVISNIKYTNRQNYQNYYVYLRKAILEDYAEKDRKLLEMKEEDRVKHEDKIKQEEEESKLRDDLRNKAKNYYQILEDEEKQEIEKEAIKELENFDGINFVKNKPVIYDNMKLNKIIEIVQERYF